MAELTWIPGALRGLFGLYIILSVVSLVAALTKPKTLAAKTGWTLAVVLGFGAPFFFVAKGAHEDKKLALAAKARLKEATDLFEERCKGAGEKIVRTVENVEGVVWMKWRTARVSDVDQFKLDDPYGNDCFGDECIKQLLRVTQGVELDREVAKQHLYGYRFVEAADPVDGKKYRYRGVVKSVATRTAYEIEQYKKNSAGRDPGYEVYGFALEREPISNFAFQFGIVWEDSSTHQDRENWIASGSTKVVDLSTGEAIAKRIGYMLDRGLGSTSGFRSPWGWAASYGPRCPAVSEKTWEFAEKVLKPANQGAQ